MIKFFLIFLQLTTSTHVFGYAQLCFKSDTKAQKALNESEFLKIPSDKIKRDGKCLDFNVTSERKKLYIKYLARKFQFTTYDSANIVSKRNCKIKVEKVRSFGRESNKTSIGSKLKISNKQSHNSTISTSKVTITEGIKSSININNENYNIICVIKRTGYSIELKSTSPTNLIIANRFIPHGKRVEISEITNTKKSNQKELSNSPNIEINKKQEQEKQLIYMSISS